MSYILKGNSNNKRIQKDFLEKKGYDIAMVSNEIPTIMNEKEYFEALKELRNNLIPGCFLGEYTSELIRYEQKQLYKQEEKKVYNEHYDLAYDESILGKGFLIYSKNYSKFLKLYKSDFIENEHYDLFCHDKSDSIEDYPLAIYKPTIFNIEKEDSLYSIFKQFYNEVSQKKYCYNENVEGHIISSLANNENKKNYFEIKNNGESIQLCFMKDVKVANNDVVVIGNSDTCSDCFAVDNLYENLENICDKIDDDLDQKLLIKR